MNSRNNSYRGFGFYLVLILIVVGVWYFLDGNTTTNSYTRAAFETDIQSGDVTAIDIVQNREIPTGSVNLTFSDSTQKVLIVSDVNEIVSYLQDQDITYYTMENVPAESWIMTLLPYLIIFGAMFIFFMIMTNQAAANAGGGSSKMMNFGKSRAKLMQPDAKKVTFANVAGLKEEKEELEEIVDLMTDVLCSTRPTLRIGGEELSTEVVKARFWRLDQSHIEYVLDRMKATTTKIRNIRGYLLTALYNAPTTIGHHFQAEVQHDLYGQ